MAEQIRRSAFSEEALAELGVRNAVDRFAAAEVQRAADMVNTMPDESGVPVDPVQRAVYMTLITTRLALMRQVLCTEELMWYESAAAQTDPVRTVCDISSALRRFDGQIEILAGGIVQSEHGTIDGVMYTDVPAERLIFAMLSLLTEMFRSEPDYRVFRLDVTRGQKEIRIVMTFQCAETDSTRSFLPEDPLPLPQDIAQAASPEKLVGRFCETFGVKLVRCESDGEKQIVLTLPAASPFAEHSELRSDRAKYAGSNYTAYHAMLARVVPLETLIGCEERYF